MAIFGDDRLKMVKRNALVALRLYLGFFYLQTGYSKLSKYDLGFGYGQNVTDFATSQMDNAYGFYAWFLEAAVLPNPDFFGLLVSWGEFALGMALFLGLFTRLAAFGGMILNFNLTFATGRGLFLPGFEAVIFWVMLTFALAPPGRVLGLDGLLQRRYRRWRDWLERLG